MRITFENNAFLHPFRALKLAIRRWSLRADVKATDPKTGDFDVPGEIPEYLQAFRQGEFLPWKGVNFRVAKVCGGAVPCLILVAQDATRGKKLSGLRNFRDNGRQALADEKTARAAANRGYRNVQ